MQKSLNIHTPCPHIHRGDRAKVALPLFEIIHAFEHANFAKTMVHDTYRGMVTTIPCYPGKNIGIYRVEITNHSYPEMGLRIDAPRGSVEIPFLPWMDEFDPYCEDHILEIGNFILQIISSLIHESEAERADRDPRLKSVLEKADDWAALDTFSGKMSLCIQGPSDYENGNVWAQQNRESIQAPNHILEENAKSSRKCAAIFFQNEAVRITPQYRASIPRIGYPNDPMSYMNAINNPPPRKHYISDAPYTSTTEVIPPIHRPGDQIDSRRR